MPHEALPVIVGLVLTFTTVKLIGPNKQSNLKKNLHGGPGTQVRYTYTWMDVNPYGIGDSGVNSVGNKLVK